MKPMPCVECRSKNPLDEVKPLVEKHKPIAFVIGGKVAMVKRIISSNKSTKGTPNGNS